MADDDRLDVRDAQLGDIGAIVDLADRRRRAERRGVHGDSEPPQDARASHRSHLESLLGDPGAVSLVATRPGALCGYLFCTLTEAPAPNARRGPVGFVDDFAVADPGDWWAAGGALMAEARARLRILGAVSMIVVTGGHDSAKRAFLWRTGMSLTSEWYQTPLV